MVQFKPFSLVLKEEIFDRIRWYDGKPSVTSVLKLVKDSDAFEDFKKHDMAGFEEMLKRKGALGTKLHEAIEKTYKTGRFTSSGTVHNKARLKFYTTIGYKWKADQLETFVGDERVGGTFDAIMVIDGTLYIIDRKTCGQRTYPELIQKYKMQISKYLSLYNTLHGSDISRAKIVVFSDKGWFKEIEVEDIPTYINMYDEVLDEFYRVYAQYLSFKNNAGSSLSSGLNIQEPLM